MFNVSRKYLKVSVLKYSAVIRYVHMQTGEAFLAEISFRSPRKIRFFIININSQDESIQENVKIYFIQSYTHAYIMRMNMVLNKLLHVRKTRMISLSPDQCFCFGQNIDYVIPESIRFYYNNCIYLLDITIQRCLFTFENKITALDR